MTKLLRLLPLLVVGCLLLQSLQPIATAINDVGEEVCDQAIEDQAKIFEDYVWEYGGNQNKKAPTKKINVSNGLGKKYCALAISCKNRKIRKLNVMASS